MSLYTLHRGDALAVLRDMPTGSADALVTDPPYSSGGFTRGDRTADPRTKYSSHESAAADRLNHFGGDNRDQRAFLLWCTLWLSEALRVVKPGGVCAVWTDWRQLPTTTDAIQAGGWVWRGVAQWVKTAPRPQKGRFAAAAEYLVWGSAGGMGDGTGACAPGAVFAEPVVLESVVPTADRVHLTQKPDAVMEWALSIVPADGVVLDPFAGSGSTGVAALRTGRRFVGVEWEPSYHAIAEQRLRDAEREVEARLPLSRPSVQGGLFG